jgi:ubiquinone/menaquinone biosynthesis C-methylase UbiE
VNSSEETRWPPVEKKYSHACNAAGLECGKINIPRLQANILSATLDFTGERFTPECEREIWYEHFHRYALAARWCKNARVLDAACGEGYGSALLARFAATVDGVDISEQAISHARQRYSKLDNVKFHLSDCTRLPFADDEFDRVVSFETLEHLVEHEQLLAEIKRVLNPECCLIMSSPDKASYSDEAGNNNEFHVKELYRDELQALINRHFSASRLLGQKLKFHSAIWSMDGVEQVALDQVSDNEVSSPQGISQAPMYYIALCATEPGNLPATDGKLWLFDDAGESVYEHYHGEIKRNMAAGGIIAELEKRIEFLEKQSTTSSPPRPVWWQRLLGKS